LVDGCAGGEEGEKRRMKRDQTERRKRL